MNLVEIATFSGILTVFMMISHAVTWWIVFVRKWWMKDYDSIY